MVAAEQAFTHVTGSDVVRLAALYVLAVAVRGPFRAQWPGILTEAEPAHSRACCIVVWQASPLSFLFQCWRGSGALLRALSLSCLPVLAHWSGLLRRQLRHFVAVGRRHDMGRLAGRRGAAPRSPRGPRPRCRPGRRRRQSILAVVFLPFGGWRRLRVPETGGWPTRVVTPPLPP